MKSLRTEKQAFASTAHLTAEDAVALMRNIPEHADRVDGGFRLHLPESPVDVAGSTFWLERSGSFMDIVDMALAQGCTHVVFDRDEPETEGIETHSWREDSP